MNWEQTQNRQEEWTTHIVPHIDENFRIQARSCKHATKTLLLNIYSPNNQFDIIESLGSTKHGRAHLDTHMKMILQPNFHKSAAKACTRSIDISSCSIRFKLHFSGTKNCDTFLKHEKAPEGKDTFSSYFSEKGKYASSGPALLVAAVAVVSASSRPATAGYPQDPPAQPESTTYDACCKTCKETRRAEYVCACTRKCKEATTPANEDS